MIALIGLIPVGAAGGLGRSRGGRDVGRDVFVRGFCCVFGLFVTSKGVAIWFCCRVVTSQDTQYVSVWSQCAGGRPKSVVIMGVSSQSRSANQSQGIGGRVLRFLSFSYRVMSSVLSF